MFASSRVIGGWVVSFRAFLWLLFGLIPIYIVLAAFLPPADDELYYWCWSRSLQLSYYDHPPLTAYMIRASTAVFGHHLLAIRIPAIVSTLTVLVCIAWLTRPRDLLPLVVFTPLFTLGAAIVTPDTPLMMFWALYVVWLVVVHERLGKRDSTPTVPQLAQPRDGAIPRWLWCVGGVILGCGILGKYTMGLALIAGVLSFAVLGNWRRWVIGYGLHLAVAFVVTLPILIHNIQYDFVPLQYQWQHTMTSHEPGVIPFLSFLGMQVLLFGVLPFGVFLWAIRNRRDLLVDPRLRVCLCLFGFPFAFFLYKATRGPLEGNWALVCYIAVWPLAALLFEQLKSRLWRNSIRGSFCVPAVCVLVLTIHLIHPISFLPPETDRITRQKCKASVAEELAESLRSDGADYPVYVTNYQWTAMLRYHQIDARQIHGLTRPSHFTQSPERPADRDRVYVFTQGLLPEQFLTGFGPPTVVGRFPLVVREHLVETFWLLEYARSPGVNANTVASQGTPHLDHDLRTGSR